MGPQITFIEVSLFKSVNNRFDCIICYGSNLSTINSNNNCCIIMYMYMYIHVQSIKQLTFTILHVCMSGCGNLTCLHQLKALLLFFV